MNYKACMAIVVLLFLSGIVEATVVSPRELSLKAGSVISATGKRPRLSLTSGVRVTLPQQCQLL